jgi:hypothetical protein
MTKLAVGCSFTQNAQWPEILWPNQHIINLGKGGVGNRFIARNCIEEILSNNKIDEVFLLFTDFSRIDLNYPGKGFKTVTKNRSQQDYSLSKKEGWVHSGGNVFKFKPKKTNFFHPMFDKFISFQYIDHTNDYLIHNNFIEIIQILSFLDNLNMNYHWSLIIDPRDKDTQKIFGTIPVSKSHPFWKFVNMKNFIDLPPFKWCLKNDLISDDDFHPSKEGYIKWGVQVKKLIDKNRKDSIF